MKGAISGLRPDLAAVADLDESSKGIRRSADELLALTG
jgi:hypothetical protein